MATANQHRILSFPQSVGSPTFNTQGLTASNSRLGYIFMAEEDATISHLWVRNVSVTGVSPVYRVSLQTLNSATGVPSGSLVAVGAEGTFTPSGSTGGVWVALTTPVSITRGTFYGIVIDYSSGTIDGSNFAVFGTAVNGLASTENSLAYFAYAAAGTYAKSANSQFTLFGYKSSSKVYGRPISTMSTTSASSSGHRVTSKVPALGGAGTTYKVRGIRIALTTPSSSSSFTAGIWDSAGTALQTVSVDTDQLRSSSVAGSTAEIIFSGTLSTLDADTAYYVGVENSGTTITLTHLEVANNEDFDPFPAARNLYLSTWNGSAWSDTTTRRPIIELIIDDVTVSGGGTSGSILMLMGIGI